MIDNGMSLPITHVGNTSIGSTSSFIKFNDVLFVPAIEKDLLSISKLTIDHPLNIDFDRNSFVIKKKATVAVKGRRRHGRL